MDGDVVATRPLSEKIGSDSLTSGGRSMEVAFTFEQRTQGLVGVFLCTDAQPPAEEVDAYVNELRRLKLREGAAFWKLCMFIVTDGAAPNTAQRHAILNDVFETRPIKMAAVSCALNKPIPRGIATAISWMNPSFKAFAPAQTAQAFAHLGLTSDIDFVWEQLRALQARLKPNHTLELMAQAIGRPRLRAATAD